MGIHSAKDKATGQRYENETNEVLKHDIQSVIFALLDI